MIRIRPYAPRDAHAVSQVIRTTMRTSNTGDYSPEKLQPLIDYFSAQKVDLLNRERTCLVAEVDGEVVGTIGMEGDELVTFFVLPSYQGKGIGRTLLAEMEARAAGQGVGVLRVASSLTAEQFYARQGYHRADAPFEGTAGLQIPMQKRIKDK